MSDSEPVIAERSASGAFIAVVIAAVVLSIGSLIWCYTLQNRAAAADQKLAAADKQNAELAEQTGSDQRSHGRHHRDPQPECRRHPEAD